MSVVFWCFCCVGGMFCLIVCFLVLGMMYGWLVLVFWFCCWVWWLWMGLVFGNGDCCCCVWILSVVWCGFWCIGCLVVCCWCLVCCCWLNGFVFCCWFWLGFLFWVFWFFLFCLICGNVCMVWGCRYLCCGILGRFVGCWRSFVICVLCFGCDRLGRFLVLCWVLFLICDRFCMIFSLVCGFVCCSCVWFVWVWFLCCSVGWCCDIFVGCCGCCVWCYLWFGWRCCWRCCWRYLWSCWSFVCLYCLCLDWCLCGCIGCM